MQPLRNTVASSNHSGGAGLSKVEVKARVAREMITQMLVDNLYKNLFLCLKRKKKKLCRVLLQRPSSSHKMR